MFLAVGRLILVLGLVIGVIFALARVSQRLQGTRASTRAGGRIEVVARRSLAKNASLLVVRVASRTFLVAQSAQQVTMLAELNGDELALDGAVEPTPDHSLAPRTVLGAKSTPTAWDAFLDQLREKTVRR